MLNLDKCHLILNDSDIKAIKSSKFTIKSSKNKKLRQSRSFILELFNVLVQVSFATSKDCIRHTA